MSVDDIRPPALLPLLSPGKHRNPRKGACFMELASLLAGERWSDHPTCTHPLLAAVARHVNDYTTDAGRQRLARLIPSVIGSTSDDPRVEARIALRCARLALPVVSAERQCAMAVAILAANRVLAELDGRPFGEIDKQSARALADVPGAARWAEGFTGKLDTTPKVFRRRSAPSIVGCAVIGVAQACIPDPDPILHDMLAGAIDDCRALVPGDARQVHALA
ncbi:MAG TPA: hypothetical protein VFC19_31515 [Candidatus Limnocylindrales bacterium]|nr:hypothetical protein [Candidatus Limnocylindrales bacterium]